MSRIEELKQNSQNELGRLRAERESLEKELDSLTQDQNLSILEGHFELMDEFLAHQGRVTNMLFTSSESSCNYYDVNHQQN